MPQDLNAFPDFPVCGFCADKGITFDEYNGYRFCGCAAGVQRSSEEPALADEANRARRVSEGG